MFTDDDRAIYEYDDGRGQQRKGDPVVLLRGLTRALGNINAVLDQAEGTAPAAGAQAMPGLQIPAEHLQYGQDDARERIAAATREVFHLGSFEEGVTERMCNVVLFDFLAWLQKKNPPGDSPPTSPQPTLECSPPSTTTPP